MEVSDLKIEQVPIADVKVHPRNPRQGDIEAIADSLAQHGQYQPIVVQRSTGHVLVGNHRLMAAEALGWETVAAVYLDVDDDQATRILLVDNRTSDLGTYDNEELVSLLDSLPDLSGTGYRADDLEIMAADLELPDIIPSRTLDSTGERLAGETIAWGYIGWGKETKIRISAEEVDLLNAYRKGFRDDNGTEAGIIRSLFEYAQGGGLELPEYDRTAKKP